MEDTLITTYHTLILGALKKCHVSAYHPFFEDYLQISRMVLLETHRDFTAQDKDMDTFCGFVFQKICWTITDELRKEYKQSERAIPDTEGDTLISQLPVATDFSEEMDVALEIEELLPLLTPQETACLYYAFSYGDNLTTIATRCHVSKQAVARWRQQIQKKYQQMLTNRLSK